MTQVGLKVPNQISTVYYQNDLLDLFGRNDTASQNSESVILLQRALESASTVDLQIHLWTNQTATSCAKPAGEGTDVALAAILADYGSICGVAASLEYLSLAYHQAVGDGILMAGLDPLQNVTSTLHPFLAQLPNNFSTGVLQQFIPRINTSATYDPITEIQFPSDCQTLAGSFYGEYGNTNEGWSVVACMPYDQRLSPWKATHLRQDFSETLFLNISGQYFKATVNTTAGYFELPNYANNQRFSDILDRDPNELCGVSCPPEGGIGARE